MARELTAWINETLPDLRDVLPGGVDEPAFIAWLAPRIGEYRFTEEVRGQVATPAEDAAEVKRIRKALHDAGAAMKALPPRASALLSEESVRRAHVVPEGNWRELERSLVNSARTLHILLGYVLHTISAQQVPKGRRRASGRHALLAEVAKRLQDGGMRATESRTVAATILLRCGVDAPTDERTARRRVASRRGKIA